MILDERGEFADALTLATATGKDLVGDVIDLGVARDMGIGEPMYLVIQVAVAVTSGGAATVQFSLVSDSIAAIAVDGSATEHVLTAAIPKATLIVGHQLVIPIPPENPAYEQFLGLISDVGTAALTAGAINAFLTHDPAVWKSYADANN